MGDSEGQLLGSRLGDLDGNWLGTTLGKPDGTELGDSDPRGAFTGMDEPVNRDGDKLGLLDPRLLGLGQTWGGLDCTSFVDGEGAELRLSSSSV